MALGSCIGLEVLGLVPGCLRAGVATGMGQCDVVHPKCVPASGGACPGAGVAGASQQV